MKCNRSYKSYRSCNNKNNVSVYLKRNISFEVNNIFYDNLTSIQIKRISDFLDWFPSNKHLSDWTNTLIIMITNDLTNYVGRCKRLMKHHASTSLYAFVLKYGKSEGIRKYNKNNNKLCENLPSMPAYWEKLGYAEDEIEQKISEMQTVKAKMSADKTRGSSAYTCRSKEYWIRMGYSEEEAIMQVKRVQSRQHTEERNVKWQQTLQNKPLEEKILINRKKGHSVKAIMARGYTEEEAIILAQEYSKKRKPTSKVSVEYYDSISYYFDSNNFYYGNKEGEYCIGNYYVDFYDPLTKTVIEFYGDFWHRNQLKYESDYLYYGKYSNEIWEYDKKRQYIIEQSEYVNNFYILWESEYINNKEDVVNLTVNLLKELRKQ